MEIKAVNNALTLLRIKLIAVIAVVLSLAAGVAAQREPAPADPVIKQERPAPIVEPSDTPSVRLFPETPEGDALVPQGQAFLIKIEDQSRIIASIRAKWEDQTIKCLPDSDRKLWYGLGGVDRHVKPGDYGLDITIETTYGRRITAGKSFIVQGVTFEKDELTVAPSMAKVPPDKQEWADEDSKAFAAAWPQAAYGKFWDGPFIRPVEGRVTSPYGERRVFNNEVKSVHGGVDLAGPEGTPIRSAAAGRVVMVRECYIAGNTVIVDHGGGVFTYYCHLSEFKVEEGQVIEQGDPVGLVGLTGRVTGPHLHWGCRVQGKRVDALSILALSEWIE
jgi:murein DD-endopeptidase MepM/ murein hydrolase activator NlpD